MTISNQTPVNQYAPNGITNTFAYTFRLFKFTDLLVKLDDVLVSSGYSVTGINQNGGGNVIFSTPPVGSKLVLERVIALQRETDYQDNGDLLADTLNADLDRLWASVIDIDAALKRSFRFGLDAGAVGVLSPTGAANAGKVVGFDATGKPAIVSPLDGTTVSVTDAAKQMLLQSSVAAIQAYLNVSSIAGATVTDFAKSLLAVDDESAARNVLGLSNNIIIAGDSSILSADSALFATVRYSGSSGKTITLPALFGNAHPVNAFIVVINESAYTVSVAKGHASDAFSIAATSASSPYLLRSGVSAIFRIMPGYKWHIHSSACDRVSITPAKLAIDGGDNTLIVGDTVSLTTGELTIAGDGTASPTTDVLITNKVPVQPFQAVFTLNAACYYDNGAGSYAWLRKSIKFSAYYNGTTDVLLSHEMIGAGSTSDATNLPIGASNALKVFPRIVGNQLVITFGGRSNAPVGASTAWVYTLETVTVT